jgi:hypothetical protein
MLKPPLHLAQGERGAVSGRGRRGVGTQGWCGHGRVSPAAGSTSTGAGGTKHSPHIMQRGNTIQLSQEEAASGRGADASVASTPA